MKNGRLVFDDNFYRLGAIILTEKFRLLEKKLREKYGSQGLPIPLDGFQTKTSYRQWLKKAMETSKGLDKPGILLGNILKQFNLDPNNEVYRNGLTWKIFYNKDFGEDFGQLISPIDLVWKGNSSPKELVVKIYPWTKEEDYASLWVEIKKIQKLRPGYRGKEKYKTAFKRDFRVYQLFIETKQKYEKPTKDKLEIESIINKMADSPKYNYLSKQFTKKDSDEESMGEQIRPIIKKFDTLLKNVSIL